MYPVPENEAERLDALRDLEILHTAPSAQFDALCRTASALFGLPIALVSLVAKDRQWFKAKCGLSIDGTSREVSLCAHAILSDTVFVVEDATKDPRFSENPLVTGPPHIRFYAGAPLIVSPGLRVGTLCVIGMAPRAFSPEDRARLTDLAQVVAAQLHLHRTEVNLRDREAHYRLLADNTADMVIRAAPDTTRLYVSPAAKPLLGYGPDELVDTKPLDFVHPDDADAYRRTLAEIGTGQVERAVSRQRYRHKDGSWLWVEATFSVTRDADGRPDGYVAAVRDISERKEAELRIAHMARHDPLTDLANRTLFQERLAQELARCRRLRSGFALLCLDLDRFKAVNDTLGHLAGDALLRTVAKRLRSVVRTEDTVARLGGDEFVIIQTGSVRPDTGTALARRVLDSMRRPIDLDGHRADVGVSIGIAMAPDDGLDPEELYRNADRALYRAKAEGRNTFRFHAA